MTLLMKHPGLPDTDPAVTTQKAFDDLWSKKGWQIVSADDAKAETAAEAATDAPTQKPSRRGNGNEEA